MTWPLGSYGGMAFDIISTNNRMRDRMMTQCMTEQQRQNERQDERQDERHSVLDDGQHTNTTKEHGSKKSGNTTTGRPTHAQGSTHSLSSDNSAIERDQTETGNARSSRQRDLRLPTSPHAASPSSQPRTDETGRGSGEGKAPPSSSTANAECT